MDALAAFLADCAGFLDEAGLVTDPADRRRFEVDVWRQDEGRAAAVVRPRDVAEVRRVVAAAFRHRVPLVPQGGNTGLAGGGLPDGSGRMVVLSLERLRRIRHLDPAGEYLVAEAGCVLAEVQEAAARMDRTFPLDLGAAGSCRIGGNVATNAGGIHALRYGTMRRLVLGVEVVLADGSLLDRLHTLDKDNRGYALEQLFVGSEGTLGVVTAASLRLVPRPRHRLTAWLAVPEAAAVVEVFRRTRDRFGELLVACELLSEAAVDLVVGRLGARRPVAAPCPWHLLLELAWGFDLPLEDAFTAHLAELMEGGPVADGTLALDEGKRRALWAIRERVSEAAARAGRVVRSDLAVPTARVPELLAEAEALVARLLPEARPIPFGHLGDGNIHLNVLVPPERLAEGHAKLREPLADLAVRLGGTFSAEHGIGRHKRALLARHARPGELAVMAALAALFDPRGILNPGVLLPDGLTPWRAGEHGPEGLSARAGPSPASGGGDGGRR